MLMEMGPSSGLNYLPLLSRFVFNMVLCRTLEVSLTDSCCEQAGVVATRKEILPVFFKFTDTGFLDTQSRGPALHVRRGERGIRGLACTALDLTAVNAAHSFLRWRACIFFSTVVPLQLRYLGAPFDAVTVVEEKGPGVRFYHPRDLHQLAEIPTVSDEEVRAITEAKAAIAAGKFVSPAMRAGMSSGAAGGGGKRAAASTLVVSPIVNCWDVSLDRGLVAVAQVSGKGGTGVAGLQPNRHPAAAEQRPHHAVVVSGPRTRVAAAPSSASGCAGEDAQGEARKHEEMVRGRVHSLPPLPSQAQMRREAGEPDSEDDEEEQQRAQAASFGGAGGQARRKTGDMYAFNMRSHFSSGSSVYALAWCGDVLVTAASAQVRRDEEEEGAAARSHASRCFLSRGCAGGRLLVLGRGARRRHRARRGARRRADLCVGRPLLRSPRSLRSPHSPPSFLPCAGLRPVPGPHQLMVATSSMDRTVCLWALPNWRAASDGTIMLASSGFVGGDEAAAAPGDSPSGGAGKRGGGGAGGSRAAPATAITGAGSATASRLPRAAAAGSSRVGGGGGDGATSAGPSGGGPRRGSLVGGDGADGVAERQAPLGGGGGRAGAEDSVCRLFARIRGHTQGVHSLVYIEVRKEEGGRVRACTRSCTSRCGSGGGSSQGVHSLVYIEVRKEGEGRVGRPCHPPPSHPPPAAAASPCPCPCSPPSSSSLRASTSTPSPTTSRRASRRCACAATASPS